jgi:hypothetical protein
VRWRRKDLSEGFRPIDRQIHTGNGHGLATYNFVEKRLPAGEAAPTEKKRSTHPKSARFSREVMRSHGHMTTSCRTDMGPLAEGTNGVMLSRPGKSVPHCRLR